MSSLAVSSYPENDHEFREYPIDKVEQHSDGTFSVAFDNGWHLWCGGDCPLTPQPGQLLRIYGRGIGAPARGMFIDGVKVWYRTEAEQLEHNAVQMYGKDAADWLNRWDAGQGVWSIAMGGLGPGYEQAIQITAAEILRWLLQHAPDYEQWKDEALWDRDQQAISDGLANAPVVAKLGLSGAQWGAALSLATALYIRGPRSVMDDKNTKERHIQVSKSFPGPCEPTVQAVRWAYWR